MMFKNTFYVDKMYFLKGWILARTDIYTAYLPDQTSPILDIRVVTHIPDIIIRKRIYYNEQLSIEILTKICERHPRFLRNLPKDCDEIFLKISYTGYNKMYEISRTCIEDFIKDNGFQIEEDFDKKHGYGFIRLMKSKNKCVSKIIYNIDVERKELSIIYVESNVRNKTDFKFFKLGLLMLLSDHLNKVDNFILNANPSSGKHRGKGKEFCLFCYYQQLGFKFKDQDWIRKYKSSIKVCKKQVKDKDHRSCLLCSCQKLGIDIGEIDNIDFIKADMHAVAKNIKEILEDYYNEIC